MGSFWQDLRHGYRVLIKSRGFLAVSSLTLALAMGANTALYSLVNGILLNPLPFSKPDQLLSLTASLQQGAFVPLRDQVRSFHPAAYYDLRCNLSGNDGAVRLTATAVSTDFFSVLGVQASRGRVFNPGEDQPGRDNLVIISNSLWQQRFSSDPQIIGRLITLDGVGREVVGIMGPSFSFPSPGTNIWIPMRLDPNDVGTYWGNSNMAVIGRLNPGATLSQAQIEVRQLVPKIREAFPWKMPDHWKSDLEAVGLQQQMVGDVRLKLYVLLATVGFVLLIACTNVANLLVARAVARQKEIAVRMALGAGRARVMRQLLTESLLLAAIGGLLGLIFAKAGLALLKSILPASTPRIETVSLSGEVLFFCMALIVITGLVFGVAPAFMLSQVKSSDALKSGRQSPTRGSENTRAGLVVVEVALSVIVVIAAGLLMQSLWRLSNGNLGFSESRILTARITPDDAFCESASVCQNFYNTLLSRVSALPGVEAAAATNRLPLEGGIEKTAIVSDVEGYKLSPGESAPLFLQRVITPKYFQIMGIPLLRGRGFVDADSSPSSPPVVVVSQITAQRYWPGQDPIGKTIAAVWQPFSRRTVVGVVGDVREYSMASNFPKAFQGEVYVPYGVGDIKQNGTSGPWPEMTLVIKESGDRLELSTALSHLLLELNPGVPPPSDVRTMKDIVTESIAPQRSTTGLLVVFATLALSLGFVGTYGLISYSVAQRSQEIGIRMALGAQRSNIIGLIIEHGIKLAVIGVVIGVVGSLGLTRAMESLLYGVHANDPLTLAGVSLLLVFVAAVAAYVPARRALKVNPNVVLREE